MSLASKAVRSFFVILFGTASFNAYAASITVNSLIDTGVVVDGLCTLREAILSANTDVAVGSCTAGTAGSDTITFTVAGTIAVAVDPLPPITQPVIIDGPGGGSVIPGIRLDGALVTTGFDERGLQLAAGSAGSTIRDLMITRMGSAGIRVFSANNVIQGNWIGTDGTTAGLGNGTEFAEGGIAIFADFSPTEGASGNVVGGTTPADRNLIDGNNGAGVDIGDFSTADSFNADNAIIQGNYFGTNAAGTALGPNGGSNGRAIRVSTAGNLTIGGTTGTTPGGACTGACNLIAGASSILVEISGPGDGTFVSGLNVLGNFIGTNVTGTAALGCRNAGAPCTGIQWGFGSSGTIGGTTSSARNVIAGLGGAEAAILVFNALDATFAPVTIAGNYIGTNTTGTAILTNGGFGISANSAEGLTIGGATSASRNVIAGHGNDAIQLDGGSDLITTGVQVQNNYIGVLADGTTAAGNNGHGVNLNVGTTSTIDFALVENNLIANNSASGIAISPTGNNNRIRTNSLYNNILLGIDQDQDGVAETNDICDVDTGANDLQNYPVITSAGLSGGQITISGTFNSLASSSFTLDFFGNTTAGDEARIYLGSTVVNTTAGCTGVFTFGPVATTLVAGNTVTATATNNAVSNSDTSELSVPVAAALVLAAPTVTKTFTPASIQSGGTSTLTIQIANPNATPITNVAFTDTYPVQISTAGVPNITNTCGGTPGSTAGSFTLTGGSIAANGSCTLTIAVTSATVGGPYTNSVTVTSDAPDGSDSADLTVTALTAPTVTKTFTPASILAGGVSTLSVAITNPNGVPLANVSFNDTYPVQITTAGVPNITNNCGGTPGSTAGTFTLTGGSIAASGSCTVTIDVTSSTPGGPYTNNVTVTSNAPDGSDSADLTVTALSAPTVTKTFTPASIVTGGVSTLSIAITNPNGVPLTNVSFSDTYPAQITTAAVPNITNNCGGTPGSTAGTFTLTGGSIAASGSCTVTIDVTSSTPGGPYTNNVTVTSNAADGSDSADLTVSALAAPTVTKSFTPSSIASGGTSTLTIQIANSNGTPLSNVAFTDTYPAQITTAAVPNITNSCGGATGSTAGTFTLTGGSVAASGSCTVTIDVTSSTPGGPYTNNVTVTSNAADGSDSADLTVSALAAPTVTKSFTPSSIASGGTSTLTIQIANSNGTPLSNVAFTDTYPAGITTAAVPNITNSCGGATGSTAGTFTLTGGSVAASGSCTLTIDVTSSSAGAHLNNVTVTSNAADGSGSATLTVFSPPVVTKAFTPDIVAAGTASTLTITLGNTNASAITGVNLTDTFPAGLVVANPTGAVNNCGGALTATSGSGSVTLTGGTIPNGGCTIAVNVTSASAATYNNTIATTDVTSANAGSPTAAASDSITFTAALTATKSFLPANIAPGATSTITITLTNPNSVPANGVAFTDNYPGAVVNAATPNVATTCVGGTLTATAGTSTLQVSGLQIPASSSCTVTVDVTSATPGTHTNTIPAGGITSSDTAATTSPTSAALTVNAPPVASKSFAPTIIASGGTSTLTITLTNPNNVALTGAAFNDTYPAEIINFTPSNVNTTCGGVVTAADGGGTVGLSGGTIPANGACTVTVTVTSSTEGAHVNTLPAGGVTVANAGPSVAPATATLTVSSQAIPTFSSLMLLLLAAILAMTGAVAIKR